MGVQWNNTLELSFIECFQAEPVLWDVNLKDYKNKLKKHDAWRRISAIMEIPIAELKKKKESLFSSYRCYKNKVKKSIRSGAGSDDIYCPIWFAYDAMDAFLGDTTKCDETINTHETSLNEGNEEEGHISTSNVNSQNTISPTIRRRKNPSELILAGETVKEALTTLKTTLNTRQSQEEDECDLHGKIIAKKLRRLSEDEREQIICEIYQMFRRSARLNRLATPAYFLPSPTNISSSSPSPQPIISYQRPHSSRTSYSESLIYQQIPQSSRTTHSKPSIQQVGHTNIYAEPPVIHIPEKSSNANSRIIIHKNKLIQPATEDQTDYRNSIDNEYNYA